MIRESSSPAILPAYRTAPVEPTKHNAKRHHRLTSGRITLFATIVTLLVVSVATAAPIPTLPPDIKRCVVSPSLGTGLRTSSIVDGVGLTPDVENAVRSRLSSYGGAVGFEGLDGLGLTAAQLSMLGKRLAFQVSAAGAKPAGWPCSPFKHRAQVVVFARARLVAAGFEPELSFGTSFPRQITFHGVRNNIETSGMLVVLGPRKVGVAFRNFGLPAGTERWTVAFQP